MDKVLTKKDREAMDVEESRRYLFDKIGFTPDSVIWTTQRRVSASKMTRYLSVYIVTPGGEIRDISRDAALLSGCPITVVDDHFTVSIRGVGINPACELAHRLTRELFPDRQPGELLRYREL